MATPSGGGVGVGGDALEEIADVSAHERLRARLRSVGEIADSAFAWGPEIKLFDVADQDCMSPEPGIPCRRAHVSADAGDSSFGSAKRSEERFYARLPRFREPTLDESISSAKRSEENFYAQLPRFHEPALDESISSAKRSEDNFYAQLPRFHGPDLGAQAAPNRHALGEQPSHPALALAAMRAKALCDAVYDGAPPSPLVAGEIFSPEGRMVTAAGKVSAEVNAVPLEATTTVAAGRAGHAAEAPSKRQVMAGGQAPPEAQAATYAKVQGKAQVKAEAKMQANAHANGHANAHAKSESGRAPPSAPLPERPGQATAVPASRSDCERAHAPLRYEHVACWEQLLQLHGRVGREHSAAPLPVAQSLPADWLHHVKQHHVRSAWQPTAARTLRSQCHECMVHAHYTDAKRKAHPNTARRVFADICTRRRCG